MKITHRNPTANWFHIPESAVVDPDYEAEVRRSTQRSEQEYQRRQKRLQRAEANLAKAQAAPKPSRRQITELVALMELRRAELEEYRRAMVSVPASAQHRGTKSFRPVPSPGGMP